MLNSIIADGRHRQVVTLPRHRRYMQPLPPDRLHPCPKEDTEGPASPRISPRMSYSQVAVPHSMLILATVPRLPRDPRPSRPPLPASSAGRRLPLPPQWSSVLRHARRASSSLRSQRPAPACVRAPGRLDQGRPPAAAAATAGRRTESAATGRRAFRVRTATRIASSGFL